MGKTIKKVKDKVQYGLFLVCYYLGLAKVLSRAVINMHAMDTIFQIDEYIKSHKTQKISITTVPINQFKTAVQVVAVTGGSVENGFLKTFQFHLYGTSDGEWYIEEMVMELCRWGDFYAKREERSHNSKWSTMNILRAFD